MSDGLEPTLSQFFEQTNKSLFEKFSGKWRAMVVETNDPLRMYRIRFKIPEIHDFGLTAEQCPWAVPAHDMGAYRSGRWTHPCIGDWVWIEFEKDHPYSPVWTGFATPTRRKMYPYPSLFGPTPIAVDREGGLDIVTGDYAEDYMPKDGRPMSHGWQDRYGNLDIHSSIGFYPASHEVLPPPAATDNLSKTNFDQSRESPKTNDPDSKFMARVSKYGNILLQSDVGYVWQNLGKKFEVENTISVAYESDLNEGDESSDIDSGHYGELEYNFVVNAYNGIINSITITAKGEFVASDENEAVQRFITRIQSLLQSNSQLYARSPVPLSREWQNGVIANSLGENVGEFTGDFDTDEDYEIARWQYLQRLIHEDAPNNKDQRRMMMLTRYGHKLEMRDVGWDVAREGEYGDKTAIGSSERDERWFKMRTKGGHLIQLSDVGSDPEEDEFVKRHLIDEIGDLDKESEFGDDARFVRLVTRSGIKIALDDRTSDTTRAHADDLPNDKIGTGALIKGRATPGTKYNDYSDKSGNPRGFFWEFDERPHKNSTTWGTPMGQMIEMNDNEEALVICSRLRDKSSQWKYLSDLEFLDSSVASDIINVAHNTHHFIIDHAGEWIRLKSRAGKGDASIGKTFGDAKSGVHQGLEIHDAPEDNAWVELVDISNRGLWFSDKNGIGIWRAKSDIDIRMWFDDTNNKVVIRNNTDTGKIQIYCSGDVEIKGRNISLDASDTINLRAGNGINLNGSGGRVRIDGSAVDTNVDVRGRSIMGYFPQINNGSGSPPGSPSGSGAEAPPIHAENLPPEIEPNNRI